MIFTEDINKKIRADFKTNEVEKIERALKRVTNSGLNVGENQFVRSVIFLANKDVEVLKLILFDFDDPRDVVSEAEDKSGNLGHWFAIPFEEIEQLNGRKYKGDIFKKNLNKYDDGLPF